jgi:hypothetical protein
MDATTTAAAPLRFFNRRNRVGRRADCHAIRRGRLRRRHAEEAEEHRHQRCNHYSLHLVCLPFLLNSIQSERRESTQQI